jgi:AcrR family transcriptional regulator
MNPFSYRRATLSERLMARTADPRRRNAILDAAGQTFRKDGYAAAHMTDIARRAKIAVGTLYLYFDSKEAIGRALAVTIFGNAAAAILRVLDKPLTRARIATLVNETFDAVINDPTVGDAGIPLADVLPSFAPDAYATVVSQIAWALDAQMRQGTVRQYDPTTLADFVVILLRRAVLQAAMNGRQREPYASTLTEMLAGALLPAGNGKRLLPVRSSRA